MCAHRNTSTTSLKPGRSEILAAIFECCSIYTIRLVYMDPVYMGLDQLSIARACLQQIIFLHNLHLFIQHRLYLYLCMYEGLQLSSFHAIKDSIAIHCSERYRMRVVPIGIDMQ